jgi:hypothetical protein
MNVLYSYKFLQSTKKIVSQIKEFSPFYQEKSLNTREISSGDSDIDEFPSLLHIGREIT